MRKTLIALMFAAALPTVAMAMPEGSGPMGPMDGPRYSEHMHGKGPYSQLDLSREQRHQIGKIMGEQMRERQHLIEDAGQFEPGRRAVAHRAPNVEVVPHRERANAVQDHAGHAEDRQVDTRT